MSWGWWKKFELGGGNMDEPTVKSDYNIKVHNDDIVIIIPAAGNTMRTRTYFKGKCLNFLKSISMLSDMTQKRAIMEAKFGTIDTNLMNAEDIKIYEQFVEHIKKHEPYFTSDNTISMAEKKFEFLLG